jgi:hypothetical protein
MLGASFLLTPVQLAELRSCGDDAAREEWLGTLEESVLDDRWFQWDKAWEPLHIALGDGELVIQRAAESSRRVRLRALDGRRGDRHVRGLVAG